MRHSVISAYPQSASGAPIGEQSALRCDSLGVHFGGLQAVSDVTLELSAGEVVALIGPNGAGKTTLLNLLSGFVRATSGTITVAGRDATGASPERLARLGVVRTFQDVRLFGAMTVLENVEVGALGTGARRGEARGRAYAMLEVLDLVERAHVRADGVSYGEERHIGIARAAAMNPRFLLLDEPAAGLSEEEGDELVSMVREIRDLLGCGILLVEHDMRVVGALADRVHVLETGRTLAEGGIEDVRRNPAVIAAYLGKEELGHAGH